MNKLVFDIETVGENFDKMDKVTQENLTKWIKKEAADEKEYEKLLADLKDGLGLSPLTGQIVAIGVLDVDQDKGVVYFQSLEQELAEFEQGKFKFKPMTEKEMLENFWEGALQYQEFISFNGRGFDVPFLVARSAVNKVKISKDLMSNRYVSSQRFGSAHIDLLDQLSFFGATSRKSLHLWCRALGIESPKNKGVDGSSVATLFEEKKYIDIAKYNSDDLTATKKLYEAWNEYMRIG
jgi:3'-5' exonuclease